MRKAAEWSLSSDVQKCGGQDGGLWGLLQEAESWLQLWLCWRIWGGTWTSESISNIQSTSNICSILLFYPLGFFLQFSKDLKPVGTDQSKSVASVLENKPKNRYNNVLPCELREPLAAPRQQHRLIHRLPCCVASFSLHQPSLSPQMILLEWNSQLSTAVHMMTTSMLTTCRCVLTLLRACSVTPSSSVLIITGACFVASHLAHSEKFNAIFHINVWDSPGKTVCVVLYGRVTTPGRSSLQLRVLCLPQSKISGEWSGRRMCRLWSCWHAATNKDEWAATQTQHPDWKQNSSTVTPRVCFRSNVSSTGITAPSALKTSMWHQLLTYLWKTGPSGTLILKM